MDDELMQVIAESKKAKEDNTFKAWCEHLDQIPEDYTLRLKGDLVADLELQPLRWMNDGLKLIDSFHGTAHVQLMGGVQGEPMHKVLYYPNFQAGSELFLKGMWLCKFPECRSVKCGDYIEPKKRKEISEQLKKLGHNLLTTIEEVQKIPEYQDDPLISKFLKRLQALIRTDYFPLYTPTSKSWTWASSRYPIRFYDDPAKEGKSDALKSYPQQWLVRRLFDPIRKQVDNLWKITSSF